MMVRCNDDTVTIITAFLPPLSSVHIQHISACFPVENNNRQLMPVMFNNHINTDYCVTMVMHTCHHGETCVLP